MGDFNNLFRQQRQPFIFMGPPSKSECQDLRDELQRVRDELSTARSSGSTPLSIPPTSPPDCSSQNATISRLQEERAKAESKISELKQLNQEHIEIKRTLAAQVGEAEAKITAAQQEERAKAESKISELKQLNQEHIEIKRTLAAQVGEAEAKITAAQQEERAKAESKISELKAENEQLQRADPRGDRELKKNLSKMKNKYYNVNENALDMLFNRLN